MARSGWLSTDRLYPGPMEHVVALDKAGRDAAAAALLAGPAVEPGAVTVLPPLAAPGKIICVGLNYRDHAAESKMQVPDYPTLFVRFTSSLVAHDAPMLRPVESDRFDYEGELVAVIGKAGRRIAKAHALDHVMGYSIFNDGSIRDFQLRTPQWTMGKNFDGTGGFGPVLVTAEDLPPGARGLRIQTRLNGQVVQDAPTDDLIFDVEDLVSMISVGITLEVGDIIVTGTPSGVGAARKPPLFMKSGDVCEVSVERIGTLRNPIRDDPA
jgi:2-keto-4-pentenoate hydratase/2-oxohepta-3-ene-1,7-dioic acid hydratase in catechol pathway